MAITTARRAGVTVTSVSSCGFGLTFFRGPPWPCMLGGASFSALAVTGNSCFFAGQLSKPGPSQGRPLEVCSCSESLKLEQGESRGWWYSAPETLIFALAVALRRIRSWCRQRCLGAAFHNQIRADLSA